MNQGKIDQVVFANLDGRNVTLGDPALNNAAINANQISKPLRVNKRSGWNDLQRGLNLLNRAYLVHGVSPCYDVDRATK